MKKKLLAILFVAMVAMLTFAVSASAASGSLGDNASYTYDEATGVMTISGTGAITKTSSIAKNTATKVIIEEGITELPIAFFFPGSGKTSNLTEVTLPASLTEIPKQAFYNCDKLTTVNIPADAQIAAIGDKAFVGSAVTSVDFNDNLKTVGAEAFYNVLSLTYADLGNSLTSIGSSAFNRCAKLQTVIAGGTYTTIQANTFYACYALESAAIADTVQTIGDGAFRQTKVLATLNIPSNLVSIGFKTFRDSGIGNITLPNTLTTLGGQAFYGCTNMTDIGLSTALTTIGDYCFTNTSLVSVTLPASVKEIGFKSFGNISTLTTLNLNEGLEVVGNYAFAESGITSLTIPSTISLENEKLGYSFAYGCKSLVTVQINAPLKVIPAKAFMLCTKLTTINVPDSVINFQANAFNNCSSLTYVNIPEGLLLLNANAFYKNTKLAMDVVIPAGVKTIGEWAFNEAGITSITLNEGLETIGLRAFSKCTAAQANAITIPSTVTSIGEYAFMQATKEAYVPASVTSIGQYAFYNTVIHAEDGAYVIEWVNGTSYKNTLGDAYVPGGEVEPEFEGVKLNVVIDGTTATATLVLENAPELTSVAFNVAYTDKLTLTAATTNLDGYTTDPAIANPVKFVWINGLANADINGTIATFTFTVTEGAEITAEDFTITYDADDVCNLVDGALVNVELATAVVIG